MLLTALCLLPWVIPTQANEPRDPTYDRQDDQQSTNRETRFASDQSTPESRLAGEMTNDPQARLLDEALPSPVVKIEMQRRLNEIHGKVLDENSKRIDQILNIILVILALMSIFVAFGGYFGFIKYKEVKAYIETLKTSSEEASSITEKIRNRSKELDEIVKVTAEYVAKHPDESQKIERAVQQDPLAPVLEKFIARTISVQRSGKYNEAKELWNSIAKIAEDEGKDALAARSWFSVGHLIQCSPEYEPGNRESIQEAISAYDQAIQLKPNEDKAYNNRGNAKNDLGDFKGAMEDYNEAIQLKPDHADAYNNRGALKKDLHDLAGAMEDYNEAIRLKPDHALAHNNRGNLKKNLGDFEGAMEDYNEAIRLKPDSADAYNNRGTLKKDLRDLAGAMEDYNEAIRLKPDSAAAYNNRGTLKRSLRDLEGAEADYNEAIRLKPNDASAYNNRGLLKKTLDDLESAMEDYNEAIRLKPCSMSSPQEAI